MKLVELTKIISNLRNYAGQFKRAGSKDGGHIVLNADGVYGVGQGLDTIADYLEQLIDGDVLEGQPVPQDQSKELALAVTGVKQVFELLEAAPVNKMIRSQLDRAVQESLPILRTSIERMERIQEGVE